MSSSKEEEEESEFKIEMPIIISPEDAEREADKAREAERQEAVRRDKAREAVRQEAVREGAALDKAARLELTERIRRWNEQTYRDDTHLFFTKKQKALEFQAEYHALVAAHEKLFANRYIMNDESGVPQYFYIYPTEELWKSRPHNNIVWTYFSDAIKELKGDARAKMEEIIKKYSSLGTYKRPDTLPPSAVPCPEPVVSEGNTKHGCASQGGGKKSKSKYSRKSKSKYLRKSKSKYLRKSKSKYSRKYLK